MEAWEAWEDGTQNDLPEPKRRRVEEEEPFFEEEVVKSPEPK